MKITTLTLKRLAVITQNLADPLTKEISLKPEITVKIEIIAEAEIAAVIETQIEEITREINQDQEDGIILETNPEIILETNQEIEIRKLIEILVMTEIEKTIAKVVVIIVRIKNTTKTGVVALVIPETTILPTIEMADMIVPNQSFQPFTFKETSQNIFTNFDFKS